MMILTFKVPHTSSSSGKIKNMATSMSSVAALLFSWRLLGLS
jgi:hypothetical protein